VSYSLGLRPIAVLVRDNEIYFHRLINGRCLAMLPGDNTGLRQVRTKPATYDLVDQWDGESFEAQHAAMKLLLQADDDDSDQGKAEDREDDPASMNRPAAELMKEMHKSKIKTAFASEDHIKTAAAQLRELRQKEEDGFPGHSRAVTCVAVGAVRVFTGTKLGMPTRLFLV
jgi:hypothetical protein